MSIKDLHHISGHGRHDMPHRAISRAPAHHNVTVILLGCIAASAVFAVLWALYAYGS